MKIKVYSIHISQENSVQTIMDREFARFTESHGAALVLNGKNPVKYYASFILPTREKQEAFADALKKRGVKFDADKEPAFVDKAYAEKYLGSDWFSAE